MPDYEYQPSTQSHSYEDAVAALSTRLTHRIVRSWVHATEENVVEAVSTRLSALGLVPELFPVDLRAFEEYLRKANYSSSFPTYYSNKLPEKAFEHFVSFQHLALRKDDVLIDIASEGSPIPSLVETLYEAKCYAQDIMYPAGIHGSRIGGDACAMPVPDGFATKAVLTCSLEHFEGDADTRLWKELGRVLRPGGRALIVPLYMFTEPAVQTDPCYSAITEIPFDAEATLYCAEGWKNRHGRFYSPDSLLNRITNRRPEFRFTVLRLDGYQALQGNIYARFALVADRL